MGAAFPAWLRPRQVRTKVFKCLGAVVEADARVMALGDVADAVRSALADDSVAVREATLELLTRLIATNPQLAGEYFDVLLDASYVSVCVCVHTHVQHTHMCVCCLCVFGWRVEQPHPSLRTRLCPDAWRWRARLIPALCICGPAGCWRERAQVRHPCAVGLLHLPRLQQGGRRGGRGAAARDRHRGQHAQPCDQGRGRDVVLGAQQLCG